LLPESLLQLKSFCFASGDVSFVLHSVEKGEKNGGDVCCTLDVWGVRLSRSFSPCDGSSRDFNSCDETSCGDGQGITYLMLGLRVWTLVGADWGGAWV